MKCRRRASEIVEVEIEAAVDLGDLDIGHVDVVALIAEDAGGVGLDWAVRLALAPQPELPEPRSVLEAPGALDIGHADVVDPIAGNGGGVRWLCASRWR